jgi:hypothetical protein
MHDNLIGDEQANADIRAAAVRVGSLPPPHAVQAVVREMRSHH